ncbi:cation acetate symporter [Actinopolymorpha sp. B9G3]|uniref:sodium/solute symporter n=1 Tax=Actinopolymorpha sp. B9G3 TaxID=3158970 RepID=UPI0032D90A35
MSPAAGAFAVVTVTVLTLAIGAYGLRLSRTTSDFYVASRTVSPTWNASAISGEYLSAASFLGAAGLIMAYGADMLWYPVGWTAGYLVLLVLVAGPLRRSGAYTLPDFAEARLESGAARRVASVLVVLIGWLYLMPQFRGAGLTLQIVTGAPAWAGGLVVGGVVLVNVLSGGMRSITFVQAFQYWLKVTAIAVPVAFLILAWRTDGAPEVTDQRVPTFSESTTVRVETDVTIVVEAPAVVRVDGVLDGTRRDGAQVRLARGDHDVAAGTALRFPAGTTIPTAERLRSTNNASWIQPLRGGQEHPLYATYSLILATFLGTMGLPHVLVRFYTNPDGRTARRTALVVLCLLGGFYLFPAIYGALGRIYAPDLLLTGRTDAVVLELPQRLVPGTGGQLLGMLVTAGAFAAFLSTSSGLAVSVTGVLSQDLVRRRLGGITGFRASAVAAVATPVALALAAERLSVASAVGLAFAVAASTFCPLLVLGIWWRRLTHIGAIAGLVTGGTLAGAAVVATLVADHDGWTAVLLAQPAAWTVPLAFGVMIVASLLSRHTPPDVARTMVRLHAPEQLDLDRGSGHGRGRVRGRPA